MISLFLGEWIIVAKLKDHFFIDEKKYFMSMKQRVAIVERFNSFVIPFEKSLLKNICNRKKRFNIRATDLSSLEL